MLLKAEAQIKPEWTGSWTDTLVVQGMRLPLVLHFSQTPSGDWRVLMDSPSQMAYDIEADSVRIFGDSCELWWKKIGARFQGQYLETGQIKASWQQGFQSLALNLKRTVVERLVIQRPQTPKGPFDYDTLNLKIHNKKAEIDLAGTLAWGREKRPEYLFILIAGSGPNDRNQTIFEHQPFRVLTHHLLTQSPLAAKSAVFRYDKRGIGFSSGSYALATTYDFADDVQAIIEGLRKRKELRSLKKIILIGHSEGGMIAPIVASRKVKGLSSLILLAAPGLAIDALMLRQSRDILALNPKIKASSLDLLDSLNSQIFQTIKASSAKIDVEALYQTLIPSLEAIPAEDLSEMGLSKQSLKMRLKQANSPWYLDFIRFDPKNYLSKLKSDLPILALNGDKDIQVDGASNLAAIQTILSAQGHKNFTVELLPNLNHLFQTCEVCDLEEYRRLSETLSPSLFKSLDAWLSEQYAQKK